MQGARCLRWTVVDENYGRVTSIALDPVEKKPLARFRPGSTVLSLGATGATCAVRSARTRISPARARRMRHGDYVAPEEAVGLALRAAIADA